MEILDAQVHPPLPLRPWDPPLDEPTKSIVSIELANAAMEAIGVDAAIVYGSVQACRVAAERYPARFRGVLSVGDPAEVDGAEAFVDEVAADPAIVGLRILGDQPDGDERRRIFAEGRWEPLLDVAEDRGVPVVLFAPLRMGLVAEIAARHPGMRIIVDHLGFPPPPSFPRVTLDTVAIGELLALAELPSIAVKLSGAPALSAEDFPFDDLRPLVRAVVDAFGPDRVMWGSDFTRVTGRSVHPPRPGGRHMYASLLEYITQTDVLRPDELVAVLAGTARRWFDWPAETPGS